MLKFLSTAVIVCMTAYAYAGTPDKPSNLGLSGNLFGKKAYNDIKITEEKEQEPDKGISPLSNNIDIYVAYMPFSGDGTVTDESVPAESDYKAKPGMMFAGRYTMLGRHFCNAIEAGTFWSDYKDNSDPGVTAKDFNTVFLCYQPIFRYSFIKNDPEMLSLYAGAILGVSYTTFTYVSHSVESEITKAGFMFGLLAGLKIKYFFIECRAYPELGIEKDEKDYSGLYQRVSESFSACTIGGGFTFSF